MLMINFLLSFIFIIILCFSIRYEGFINYIGKLDKLNSLEAEDLYDSLEHIHLKNNNNVAQEVSHKN